MKDSEESFSYQPGTLRQSSYNYFDTFSRCPMVIYLLRRESQSSDSSEKFHNVSHQVLVSRHSKQTIPDLRTHGLETIQQRLPFEELHFSLQCRVGYKRVDRFSLLQMFKLSHPHVKITEFLTKISAPSATADLRISDKCPFSAIT